MAAVSSPQAGCCGAPSGRGGGFVAPASAPKPPRPERLERIPGGGILVGTAHSPLPQDGESPPRRVELKPFLIDPLAVTNADFAAFIAATGHVTEAERFGWSPVFRAFAVTPTVIVSPDAPPWWAHVDGACWHAPADAFAPNGYGLFNMVGNTWEWTVDAFRIRSISGAAKQRNAAVRADNHRVLKGGS